MLTVCYYGNYASPISFLLRLNNRRRDEIVWNYVNICNSYMVNSILFDLVVAMYILSFIKPFRIYILFIVLFSIVLIIQADVINKILIDVDVF